MLYIIIIYFLLLLAISRLTAKKSTNSMFMRGGRRSPWYLVAFGMIGASISGVTFVSVPGMVIRSGMTYLHMCFGFFFGYLVVAFVLLPIYYRLNLTSIYTMLRPLGSSAYKTGAAFFLLSKLTGAAARFYVPCFIIAQSLDGAPFTALLSSHGALFPVTAVCMVALIWIYTRRGGIRTLVWTDTLQTLCMFAALCLIISQVSSELHPGVGSWQALHDSFATILSPSSPYLTTTIGSGFSWNSFLLSFLSGIFIVIVMTGLDQDMMQKNLTCSTLRDAQKDMCTYGIAFLPANFLFLSLGAMLCQLCMSRNIALPDNPDQLLTMFAVNGSLGTAVTLLFSLGIVAAAFSSADSSLTALTTCFCVDILGMRSDDDSDHDRQRRDNRVRHCVHIVMAVLFLLCIIMFHAFNSRSLIDAIYTLCSYTYGPLLGLFTYALIHSQHGECLDLGRKSIVVCIASPVACMLLDRLTTDLLGYKFGYELLIINGLLTYIGLLLCRKTSKRISL